MSSLSQPCAIVFDLDGTLVDSAPDICAMANTLLAENGGAPLSLAEARSFVGAGADVFVRRMRKARALSDSEHDRLLARFLELYEGQVAHSTLYPGVLDTLDVLAASGHTLGICTNKPLSPTRIVLEHFGLTPRFGVIVGGDSLPTRKPDPSPLCAAFEGLGVTGGLYVGDSEVDAEAAARARVPFFLFTEGYRKAPLSEMTFDASFSHWDALPAALQKATNRFT